MEVHFVITTHTYLYDIFNIYHIDMCIYIYNMCIYNIYII